MNSFAGAAVPIAELLFYLAVDFGDQKMTGWAIHRYGLEVEKNPKMKAMYQSDDFRPAWATRAVITLGYLGAAYYYYSEAATFLLGQQAWLLLWSAGAIIPMLASLNLMVGLGALMRAEKIGVSGLKHPIAEEASAASENRTSS